jgi:hypothetical protein
MAKPLRDIFAGTMGGVEYDERSPEDQKKADLLAYGQQGYRTLLVDELDWTHKPWLIARDGSVWFLEAAQPLGGQKPATHALLVGRDSSWTFLVSAAASGQDDAPRDARELEERQKRKEERQREAQQEHERALAQKRKTATPVTVGRLFDPQTQMTLRAAAQHVHLAGGRIESVGDRLVVYLPPTAPLWNGAVLNAARILYAAERVVLDALAGGEALPDSEVTPAGALIAP